MNCSLCGWRIGLGEMCIGVRGGGQFHPACWEKTLALHTRARTWLRWRLGTLIWLLRGRPENDIRAVKPVHLGAS